MSTVVAITKKELGVYFTTVVGYAGFGAYSFLMGLLFVTALNKYQQFTELYLAEQKPELLAELDFNSQILTPMLSTGLWMFLFFVPFLTMRLFAEEKSARTFELLMTAPITSLDIVLGKFLAAGAMIGVMSAIPLVFPLILHLYGTGTSSGSAVDWAPVWTGSGALLLLGLCFVALGLLVSALTESQIVAALLTFAALLLCFVLPMIAGRIEGDWRAVIEYATPLSHVTRGMQGRVLVSDLVYFATFVLTVLFLTTRVVESHRWR